MYTMDKTLFVCYAHGCRGEGLAVRISKHDLFRTLEANVVNTRTVIENDYFDKKFLNSWRPTFDGLTNKSGQNIVVPSHFFYDELKEHYPQSTYVTIDIPKDLDEYRQSLYERFYLYSTNNTAELVGECENRLREYNPEVSATELKEFTARVLKEKVNVFGDIRCMAKGLPATEQNRRQLANLHTPSPISKDTRDNSLVIAYEDVRKVDAEVIADYFRRSSGSL